MLFAQPTLHEHCRLLCLLRYHSLVGWGVILNIIHSMFSPVHFNKSQFQFGICFLSAPMNDQLFWSGPIFRGPEWGTIPKELLVGGIYGNQF